MRLMVFFGFCVTLLTLTGCVGAFDPFQRPGNWAATGASNETIAQQVANPSDLISGQSDPLTNGVAASAGDRQGARGERRRYRRRAPDPDHDHQYRTTISSQ